MNQDQRKFLIGQVEKTANSQIDEIQSEMPTRPSLNNYLVAACLDNTIQLQSVESLKEKIRASVLKFGNDDALVTEEDGDGYSYKRRRDMKGEVKQKVTVDAKDIFVIPQAYQDALREYEEKKKQLDDKIKNIEAQKNTIIMKIQIGSAGQLDKLVMQVDSMGDLNLMNSQLILGAEETKELGAGKKKNQ